MDFTIEIIMGVLFLIMCFFCWFLYKKGSRGLVPFIVFLFTYGCVGGYILFIGMSYVPENPVLKTKICVSVAPYSYFVEKISGIVPRVMVPAGADPHTYEPSPADMAAIETTDIYVKIGHPMFEFETMYIDRQLAARKNVIIVNCSENATLIPEDPHLWLGISEMKSASLRIGAALAGLDPVNAAAYRRNAEKVVSEIESLKSELDILFAKTKRRKFLAYHPAFGYFARDFGLEQISVEKEGKEPGPKDIEEAVNLAKAAGIKTIFTQAQTDPRNAEAVAREIGGRAVQLDPLAHDWPDNMRRIAKAIKESLDE